MPSLNWWFTGSLKSFAEYNLNQLWLWFNGFDSQSWKICAVASEWADNVQLLLFVRTFQIQIHLCLSLTHELICHICYSREAYRNNLILSRIFWPWPCMEQGVGSWIRSLRWNIYWALNHRYRTARAKNYNEGKRGRGESPFVFKLTSCAWQAGFWGARDTD